MYEALEKLIKHFGDENKPYCRIPTKLANHSVPSIGRILQRVILTGLLQVVKNSGSEIGSLKYDRMTLERSPLGGSFVILTPFCSTDTGKLGDG